MREASGDDQQPEVKRRDRVPNWEGRELVTQLQAE
jgi:hypothetical protein